VMPGPASRDETCCIPDSPPRRERALSVMNMTGPPSACGGERCLSLSKTRCRGKSRPQ
jgi:hypothetical protein